MLYNYSIDDEELQHLTAKQKRCFLKLQKMGVPVKIWYQNNPEYEDYRGLFWIDTEEEMSECFLDYYGMPWGSEKLNKVLESADLYYEWANAAYAHVYES